MRYPNRLFLLVPATGQATANTALAPLLGPDAITAPLVPVGSPVGTAPTHYICDTQSSDSLRAGIVAALDGMEYQTIDRQTWDPAKSDPTFADVIAAYGLQVPEPEEML